MNEWAARECPVIQAPPLVCDLSLRLSRVTVEEVRAVERMAPFGADNPAPVFLLERAIVEGIYPVSDGKHSRLRLHQGSASLYAVWFGMPPQQVPYQMGDAVDAALSLSVYEGARGAQISGRILDLHPAGLGPDAARQAALVDALKRGASLSPEERQLVCPSREEVAAVYRELKTRRWHADDLQPLCARMGTASTGKTLVAVEALRQVGLVAEAERDGAACLELVRVAGKKKPGRRTDSEVFGGEVIMAEGKTTAAPAPVQDSYTAKSHLQHQVHEVGTVVATATPAEAADYVVPSEARPEIITYDKLLEAIQASGRAYNMDMIEKAYHMADEAHKDVKRRSGEPYICHPLAVARLVLDPGHGQREHRRGPAPRRGGGHPHHRGPDQKLPLGRMWPLLVDGVTKLTKIQFSSIEEQQAENPAQDAAGHEPGCAGHDHQAV